MQANTNANKIKINKFKEKFQKAVFWFGYSFGLPHCLERRRRGGEGWGGQIKKKNNKIVWKTPRGLLIHSPISNAYSRVPWAEKMDRQFSQCFHCITIKFLLLGFCDDSINSCHLHQYPEVYTRPLTPGQMLLINYFFASLNSDLPNLAWTSCQPFDG